MPSIIETAQARGSNSKTKAGAWRYLLSRLPSPIPGLELLNNPHVTCKYFRYPYKRARWSASDVETYRRTTWENRIERRADRTAKLFGLKPRKEGQFRAWKNFCIELDKATPGLPRCNSTDTSLYRTYRIADVLIIVRRTVDFDWDRYSKSWHSMYGPAKTVRTLLTVKCYNKRNETIRQLSCEPRRGLLHIDRRAIELIAELKKLKARKGQRALRIDPRIDVVRAKNIKDCPKKLNIYSRKLLGEVIGYVAVHQDGTHYHAGTVQESIAGCQHKRALRRLQKMRGRMLRSGKVPGGLPLGQFLQLFGFCNTGVNRALEMLQLDSFVPIKHAINHIDRIGPVRRLFPCETDQVLSALRDGGCLNERVFSKR